MGSISKRNTRLIAQPKVGPGKQNDNNIIKKNNQTNLSSVDIRKQSLYHSTVLGF